MAAPMLTIRLITRPDTKLWLISSSNHFVFNLSISVPLPTLVERGTVIVAHKPPGVKCITRTVSDPLHSFCCQALVAVSPLPSADPACARGGASPDNGRWPGAACESALHTLGPSWHDKRPQLHGQWRIACGGERDPQLQGKPQTMLLPSLQSQRGAQGMRVVRRLSTW